MSNMNMGYTVDVDNEEFDDYGPAANAIVIKAVNSVCFDAERAKLDKDDCFTAFGHMLIVAAINEPIGDMGFFKTLKDTLKYLDKGLAEYRMIKVIVDGVNRTLNNIRKTAKKNNYDLPSFMAFTVLTICQLADMASFTDYEVANAGNKEM